MLWLAGDATWEASTTIGIGDADRIRMETNDLKISNGSVLRAAMLLVSVGFQTLCAQQPSYTLAILHDSLASPATYEFDMYLLNTGATSFEYANNSQYCIDLDPLVQNGGTLSVALLPGTCELNSAQQLLPARIRFDDAFHQLQIVAHAPSGAGRGTMISNVAPGTRVGRFKIVNTSNFASRKSFLSFHNDPPGLFTKVFAYRNGLNVEITDSTAHLVSTRGLGVSVELVSFTGTVQAERVQLHWTTATEARNRGFEVERRIISFSTRFVGSKTNNAPSEWMSIGFLAGAGTSTSPQSYAFSDLLDSRGLMAYRLKQIDENGTTQYIGSVELRMGLSPKDYGLSQNYPNPFNPVCTIRFAVHTPQRVAVRVYNITGQLVSTLFDEEAEADILYFASFDGHGLSSGMYFYAINSSEVNLAKKMVLLK